jgi:hypothetical protein
MRRTAAVRLAAVLVACAACATAPVVGPERRDTVTDVPRLAERCERGFPVACRDLGRAALVGDGLPLDDRLAAAYVTKACEIGDASACSDLSVLAAIGRGLPQADARSVALAKRACEAGSALACSNLGVMTAEGVNRIKMRPDEAGEEGPKTTRYFRTACEAGVPEGCLNLGTALEGGQLVNKDVPAAAEAWKRACDHGLALGCYRLAGLYARYPATQRDAPLEALQTAACKGGVAPACDLAHQPLVLPSARTPSPRLVSEPHSLMLGIPGTGGFHPTDLWTVPGGARRSREEARHPPPSLVAAVPPALRERLGLGATPRAEDAADAPVDLLVALRRHQLGACYEVARRNPAVRTEVLVSFLIQSDGKPADVHPAASPADGELEVCASELVQEWEFPAAQGGWSGPYLVRYTFEPAPAGATPEFAAPGGLRPALAEPGCLERELRLPPEFGDTEGTASVKVAIDGRGVPVLFHAITPTPEPIVTAIGEAVKRCRWTPGADPRGQPATIWLTVPVRIAGR